MIKDSKEERIIEVINLWRNIEDIVRFALDRNGYGNTDGGFGIVYAHELDDYDIEVDGAYIPKEHIEIYGYWGKPDGYEFHVKETDYLLTLSKELSKKGHKVEAQTVHEFIHRIT